MAVQYMDNLHAVLSPLADLHAQVLRVDPTNFPVSHPGRSRLAAQPRRAGGVWGGAGEDRALRTASSPAAGDPVFQVVLQPTCRANTRWRCRRRGISS